MADIRLAYFMATKEGASYLGGLLVVDGSGIPMDFRYTEPITPSKLQSILYGKALEPHLKEEVIQRTLLKELKGQPDLLILPAADLAAGLKGEAKCPVLALQKSQEQALPRLGEVFRVNPRELLLQLAEGAAPLRVIFAAGVEASTQEQVAQKLVEAGWQMDLLEPLERVTAALGSLVQKD